jgi:phage tail-like protein
LALAMYLVAAVAVLIWRCLLCRNCAEMDVNGLPMWMLSRPQDFGLEADAASISQPNNLAWDSAHGHLMLASQQAKPAIAEDENFARLMLSQPSPVCDAAGTFAYWHTARLPQKSHIRASGFAPGATEIELGDATPQTLTPTDMALGADQILYVARDGSIIMADLRTRYPLSKVSKKDFSAHLVAPCPDGGVWAFDQIRRQLAKLNGYPLRLLGINRAALDAFGPKDLNANPPKMKLLSTASIEARFDAVAIATSAHGNVALLAWEAGQDAMLFMLENGSFNALGRTQGLRFPWSIAWQGEACIAVIASNGAKPAAQAYIYSTAGVSGADVNILPDGKIYMLQSLWPGGFCNSLGGQAHYLVSANTGQSVGGNLPTSVRRLVALSGTQYARRGGVLTGPFDAGQSGCVWHRIYAEAAISQQCCISLHIYADDAADPPARPGAPNAQAWARHTIGGLKDAHVPDAAWCTQPSEIAGAVPILACPQKIGSAGLFTVLLQKNDCAVRRIKGRYCWIYIEFEGDSQSTPELGALRLYANRLSYRDAYLPDFYTESLAGADSIAVGPATGQDFLERLLGLFEGSLTEIEGQIAGAWALTDPVITPDIALPWVGSWIGIESDKTSSPRTLRQNLIAAPYTAGLHGTLGGLLATLEIATGGRCVSGGIIDTLSTIPQLGSLCIARLAGKSVRALMLGHDANGRAFIITGGAVTRGDIVVVEGFRMRRTFATLLGANLADQTDPLTLDMATSGNSFVGDTLILGEEVRGELMALFRADAHFAEGSQNDVQAFFARLAYRVFILLRTNNTAPELARIREIAAEAAPAHIDVQISAASTPLIVGAAALVGIDTYLMREPVAGRVRINHSILGQGDLIESAGWLDSRADGPQSLAPIAIADGPSSIISNAPFLLSAAHSTADQGRRISRYIWTWEG